MPAPTVTAITLDQLSYSPGQTITATVKYTAGTSPTTQTLTGTATDATTQQVGMLQVTFTVMKNDTTTVNLVDSGGRAWAKSSDTGSVAIFTASA